MYFTIFGVKIIVRYNEDVFKETFQYRGSSVHTIHYHEAFSFNKMLAKSKWIPFKWKRLRSASDCSGSSVSLYVLFSKINLFSFCYPFQWSANFCSLVKCLEHFRCATVKKDDSIKDALRPKRYYFLTKWSDRLRIIIQLTIALFQTQIVLRGGTLNVLSYIKELQKMRSILLCAGQGSLIDP